MRSVERTLSRVRELGADGVVVSNLGTLNLAKAKKILLLQIVHLISLTVTLLPLYCRKEPKWL